LTFKEIRKQDAADSIGISRMHLSRVKNAAVNQGIWPGDDADWETVVKPFVESQLSPTGKGSSQRTPKATKPSAKKKTGAKKKTAKRKPTASRKKTTAKNSNENTPESSAVNETKDVAPSSPSPTPEQLRALEINELTKLSQAEKNKSHIARYQRKILQLYREEVKRDWLVIVDVVFEVLKDAGLSHEQIQVARNRIKAKVDEVDQQAKKKAENWRLEK